MSADLLEHGNRMLGWFETEAGQLYKDFLTEEQDKFLRKLCKEKDVNEVLRLQGDIRTIRWVLEIPTDIRQYQIDKRNGKVK